MLRLVFTVLYTALILGANTAQADRAAAEAILVGDMRKLVFLAEPKPFPEAALVDLTDTPRGLEEWRGRWVVVNFWATWCAPCRKEMPALDCLSAVLAPEGPAVVTVATGRNAVPAIERFFAEIGVENLPALRDPKSALARSMGIFGLPVTVIVNPQGEQVARLIGDAEWDSPEAVAVLRALTE